jgi:hypothetical protein
MAHGHSRIAGILTAKKVEKNVQVHEVRKAIRQRRVHPLPVLRKQSLLQDNSADSAQAQGGLISFHAFKKENSFHAKK